MFAIPRAVSRWSSLMLAAANRCGSGGKSRLAATLGVAAALLLAFTVPKPAACQAWGSLNNFDCVNDTGVEAHGFDIEMDDTRTTDVTYTYDWNHYGVPKVTDATTDLLHPRVLVRYASKKNASGAWTAYTAVPSAPIAPTDGHLFTDPSVNFGGEHFGVGYFNVPSAIRYFWLVDDGAGGLRRGTLVNVSTPVFNYIPPVPNVAPAAVVAVVVPPPPVLPPKQFGEATWVKAIKTTSHNSNKVHLNDLVGDDPALPQPWANGEPDEVETEWKILQTDFNAQDGGVNGELAGAAEELPGGDEVITRRYEFYKYTGPFDAESGEAMADTVGPDGIHGVGTVTYNDHIDPITHEWVVVTVDLSTIEIVGDFFGAQMSAFDAAPALGLIDHIQDGEVNAAYADRTIVIPGGAPFLASIKSGALPGGMILDSISGVLSGTPTAAGVFTFEIEAADINGTVATNTYTVTISGDAVPATYNLTTSASPLVGGTTSGDGTFNSGDIALVEAVPNPEYDFVSWTHDGTVLSVSSSYSFPVTQNLNLMANFALKTYAISTTVNPGNSGTTTGDNTYAHGDPVTVNALPAAGFHFVNWTENGAVVSNAASYSFTATGNRTLAANFELDVSNLEISSAVATSSVKGNKTDVAVIIFNSGTAAADSVTIVSRKDARLGGKQTGTPAPILLGNIAPGGSAPITLTFAGVKPGLQTLDLTLTTTSGSVVTLSVQVTVP